MYKIWFVDKSNYGSVLHQITVGQGVDKIKLSADKISSLNYFAREPKRLEFTCLMDAWIEANLFAGEFEHQKYISFYEVILVDGTSKMFHGIIDTSLLIYNVKDDSVKFTCYDKLKLFTLFSELKKQYNATYGYPPWQVFGFAVNNIESEIALNVPVNWNNYTLKELVVSGKNIHTFNWKEVLEDFQEWGDVKFGLKTVDGRVWMQYRVYGWEHIVETGKRRSHIVAKTWIFYNNICAFESDSVDVTTEWYDNVPELDAEIGRICYNYQDELSLVAWGGSYNGGAQSNSYQVDFDAVLDADFETASDTKTVYFNGNAVPGNIHPKGFYDGENESAEQLKVLKVSLLLHNLTIKSEADGELSLIDKDFYTGNEFVIDVSDVVSFKRKRINRSQLKADVLDVLMGETIALKEVLEEYYNSFLSQKWEINVVIDDLNKNTLALSDNIVLKNKRYRITEIQKDILKEEYKIKAWEL